MNESIFAKIMHTFTAAFIVSASFVAGISVTVHQNDTIEAITLPEVPRASESIVSDIYKALNSMLSLKFSAIESKLNAFESIFQDKFSMLDRVNDNLNDVTRHLNKQMASLAREVQKIKEHISHRSKRSSDDLEAPFTDLNGELMSSARHCFTKEDLINHITEIKDAINSSWCQAEKCSLAESDLTHDLKFQTCAEVMLSGKNIASGVYTLHRNGTDFEAFCDMDTDGGGWTVFQRRTSGDMDFYRFWSDYKDGFGYLEDEFWLGLDNINFLSSLKSTSLRIEMEWFDGNRSLAVYKRFQLGSEDEDYRLMVEGHNGDAEDALSSHSGMAFSTQDVDNDLWTEEPGLERPSSCAKLHIGAWWYRDCYESNLNGPITMQENGVLWNPRGRSKIPVIKTEMKLRPTFFPSDTIQ